MSAATASVKSAGRIDLVQVLRAVAASMIVFSHSQAAVFGLERGRSGSFVHFTFLPWGGGVDLFFVISGFIMVYASQSLFKAPGGTVKFLRRRLTRIAPLYWVCSSAYLAIIVMAHLKGDPKIFSLPAIAASYLFIPFKSFGVHQGAFPLFDLGWTLNYEMFFYVLFALTLSLPRRLAGVAMLAMLVALTVAGLVLRPAEAALQFWTQPIVLDFGLGVLVGNVRCSGVRWPKALRLALAVLGVVAFSLDPLKLFSGPIGTTASNGLARVVTSGLPVAVVLAAAVLGPDVSWRPLSPLVALGNVSYSLYLVHPFVLILVEKVVTKADLISHVGPWPIGIATLALSTAAAFASFHLLEEPLTRLALRFTRRLGRSQPSPTAPPQLSTSASFSSPAEVVS